MSVYLQHNITRLDGTSSFKCIIIARTHVLANLKMLFSYTHLSFPHPDCLYSSSSPHVTPPPTSHDALRRRHPEAPPGDLLVQPRRLQRRREGARTQEDGQVAKEGQCLSLFSLLGIGGHLLRDFFYLPTTSLYIGGQIVAFGLRCTFFEPAKKENVKNYILAGKFFHIYVSKWVQNSSEATYHIHCSTTRSHNAHTCFTH